MQEHEYKEGAKKGARTRFTVRWVKSVMSLVQRRIRNIKHCINDRPKSVFKDKDAVKCLT